MKPGFGHPPFRLDCSPRNAKQFCYFLIRETGEKSQLYNFSLSVVDRIKLVERLVECNKSIAVQCCESGIRKRYTLHISAVRQCLLPTNSINQEMSHCLSTGPYKMALVTPT